MTYRLWFLCLHNEDQVCIATVYRVFSGSQWAPSYPNMPLECGCPAVDCSPNSRRGLLLQIERSTLVQTKTEDPQFCETWQASVRKSSTTNIIKLTFVNRLATVFAIPLYSATSTSWRCHCCFISFFHYTKKDSINTTFITLPLELYRHSESPSETS